MFFSVIIPVYNTEAYLARAIDSVLGQCSSVPFEVILVNDGSTDNSGEICDVYGQKNPNIKVIHKPNEGQAVARNCGLDVAAGEYIIFLDSDDWLQNGSLDVLSQALFSKSVDVLMFLFNFATGGSVHPCERRLSCRESVCLDSEEFLNTELLGPEVWLVICRREFLIKNEIRFFEGIYAEDPLFTARVSCFAEKFMVLNYHAYNYFQREGSVMRNHNYLKQRKLCIDTCFVMNELLKMQEEFNFSKTKVSSLQRRINGLFDFLFSKILSVETELLIARDVYKEMWRLRLLPLQSFRADFKYYHFRHLIRKRCPVRLLRMLEQFIVKTSHFRYLLKRILSNSKKNK